MTPLYLAWYSNKESIEPLIASRESIQTFHLYTLAEIFWDRPFLCQLPSAAMLRRRRNVIDWESRGVLIHNLVSAVHSPTIEWKPLLHHFCCVYWTFQKYLFHVPMDMLDSLHGPSRLSCEVASVGMLPSEWLPARLMRVASRRNSCIVLYGSLHNGAARLCLRSFVLHVAHFLWA